MGSGRWSVPLVRTSRVAGASAIDLMSEITEHLSSARRGDPQALDRVYRVVYPHLRELAAAHLNRLRSGDTFTPTALVHEAWVRLNAGAGIDPRDRVHLMACFARAIRYILIDDLRARRAAKRGGGLAQVTLTTGVVVDRDPASDLLEIDRALAALGQVNDGLRELVELRFFAGLSEQEVAELRGVSTRTIRREWRRARAFLHQQLSD